MDALGYTLVTLGVALAVVFVVGVAGLYLAGGGSMNWKFWLHGLVAAIINGAASAVVLVITDPADFNLGAGLNKLAMTAAVFGLMAAANYLKQSPLPDIAPVILLACLLAPGVVHAQTVNPTAVDFDHVDFAQTDQYEIGYFSSATAAAPVQTATLAKPATCSPCTSALPARPSQFGNWWVGIRAAAGGASPVVSDWSNKAPFVRAPVAPAVRGLR